MVSASFEGLWEANVSILKYSVVIDTFGRTEGLSVIADGLEGLNGFRGPSGFRFGVCLSGFSPADDPTGFWSNVLGTFS